MTTYRTTREIRVPKGTEIEVDPVDTTREYSKETVVIALRIEELPSRAEIVIDLEDALAAHVVEEVPEPAEDAVEEEDDAEADDDAEVEDEDETKP